jgi:hypothetical protein
MNYFDLFADDATGIVGSEPRPHDIVPVTEALTGYLEKIQRYMDTMLHEHKSKVNKRGTVTASRIDWSQEIDQLTALWLSEFHLHNLPVTEWLININDQRSHIMHMLNYCYSSRLNSNILKLERNFLSLPRGPNRYNWNLLINACLSLAELASRRHIHLYEYITFTSSVSSSLSSSSSSPPSSFIPIFPSLEEIRLLIDKYFIGFINQFYYWNASEEDPRKYDIQVCMLKLWNQWKDAQKKIILSQRETIPKWIEVSPEWIAIRAKNTNSLPETKFQQGILWKIEGPSYVDRFLWMCNHILGHIENEHRLLDMYESVDVNIESDINMESCRLKVHEWLIQWNSKQPPDSFIKDLSKCIYEHIAPFGSYSYSKRMKTVSHTTLRPDLLFQKMIGTVGVITINALFENELLIKNIVSNPSHPLYDFVLLISFHFNLYQRLIVASFYDEYVIPSSHLLQTGEFRLEAEMTHQQKIKRPLIVNITGKWCVHFNKTWYICHNMTEVILTWLKLIKCECNSSLMNGNKLDHWLIEFGLSQKPPSRYIKKTRLNHSS